MAAQASFSTVCFCGPTKKESFLVEVVSQVVRVLGAGVQSRGWMGWIGFGEGRARAVERRKREVNVSILRELVV